MTPSRGDIPQGPPHPIPHLPHLPELKAADDGEAHS